jgi:ubiquinone/menaquinone biosynthesis C-methylase UbiE
MAEHSDGKRNEHHDHHDADQFHGGGAWDDETAEWYVKHYGHHPTNRMAVECAQLQPNDLVVDIGCGGGEAVREAATRLPDGRVSGVDPTPAMIRLANELSAAHPGRDRIQFLEGSAEDLPLPDASATVAMAINSLHHWQGIAAGLAEVLRVLVPGGRLLIADEQPEAGCWGHGKGPMTDPVKVVHAVKRAGFVEIKTTLHSEGDVSMNLLLARRPARHQPPKHR